MNFLEAIAALKQGKKVSLNGRKSLVLGEVKVTEERGRTNAFEVSFPVIIADSSQVQARIFVEDIMSSDWEVAE